MPGRRLSLRLLAPIAVIATCLRTPSGAEGTDVRPLLRDGDYTQVVASVMRDGGVDPARAAAAARELLVVALEQPDPNARAAALRAAVRLRDPALLEAVRPAAHSPDRYEQALALDLLAGIDPQRARAELLAALDSPYRAIRLRGLQGLTRLRDVTLVDRFDKILTADADPDLRLFAVRALLECGTPSVIPLLHRGLDDAADAVREEAVKALVQLGDRGVAAVVRRRLADAATPERRVFALRLAGQIPDPTLLNDVVPFLADPSPELRAAAAAAVLANTAGLAAPQP